MATTILGNLGLHVLRNPVGTYSLVGSIPRALCNASEPTRADVMGGRVAEDGKVYRPRVYATVREAFAAIEAYGACYVAGCACATLRQREGA